MITSSAYTFCDMQAVSKKRETSSIRKSELQKQKSDLEERVQGLDERLENALIQLEVGCVHHAMCISSFVTHSDGVCARCRCVCCQY